jgi:hypothetical protein
MNANKPPVAALPRRMRVAQVIRAAMFVAVALAAVSPRAHAGGTAASGGATTGQAGSDGVTPSHPSDPLPAAAPDAHWPEAETVNDLMQAEMRAAIMLQRQRAAGRALSVGGNSDTREKNPDRLDLAAIYGIGSHLHVEVVVNGRSRQYRYGKKWPDGGSEGEDAYALVAIDGTCVKLGGANGNRTVCMDGRAAGSVR